METRSRRLKENDEMDGKTSKAVCGMSDVNDDKRDDVSLNSMSSSQLSTSRLKLDKALLRKRNLEKRLELERQLKMLDLQEEVDIAELECKAIEDDERLPVDKCGINAKVKNYLDYDTGCNDHSEKVCNISKIDWVEELKDTLHTMVSNMVLPKIDMMYFDGQPGQYYRFISQFNSLIESKVSDKGQLLSYLLYYCKGKARTAIEACISLPIHLGYDRAKQILYDLFGKEHLVARELIIELLNHKPVGGSADVLSDFAIKLRNVCITLKQMGYMSDVNSTANLEVIVSCLPLELQNKWVEVADKIMMYGKEPSFEEFVVFVEERARIARTRYGRLVQCNSRFGKRNSEGQADRISRFHAIRRDPNSSVKVSRCEICVGDHEATDCPRLAKMNVKERRQEVRKRGLCYLCLRKGHIAMTCNSGIKCDVENCKVRHNSLLHIDSIDNHVVNLAKDWDSSKVCLGIVPVRLYGPKGCLETYALLDSGSDTSLVCEELINQLGIKGKETSIRVATVNGTTNCDCLEVYLEVFSLDERGSVRINKVYTTKKLPIDHATPLTELQLKRWKHLKDITLPKLKSNYVGILIGCDAPDAHWVLEQRLGDRKHPFAVRTHLGWMIIGPKGVSRSLHQVQWCHCSTNDILRDLGRLYDHEFEDTNKFRNGYPVKDKKALEIVSSSFRLEGGHFQVGLPWKYDKPRLPNNLELASRRLECLRRRFMKDNSLLEKYQVVNKHLRKGYIIEASEEGFDYDAVCWYIPHHPVINPKRPGKLRIVFDCAAVYQGCYLNDQLLRGPNTVNSLIGVLLRFRLGNVALAADIEEMFLQIKIPRQDRGAFRLLWWGDGDIRRTDKARVAPSKVQAIPRLELTAAVLTARMGSQLQSELGIKLAEVNFWTDSMIVLHYIRNEKSQFKTFIANRISTIQSLTKVDQLRFVPSKENISDLASRGVKFDIDDVKVWEESPRFLKKPKECWPAADVQGPDPHLLEVKKAMSAHVMAEKSTVDQLINYYSDYTKLLKAVAWLTRFKRYLLVMRSGRTDLSQQVGMLRFDELNFACLDLILYVQRIVFRKEIEMLSSDTISKVKITNSPLRTLNPMMIGRWALCSADSNSCLCVNMQWCLKPCVMVIHFLKELEGSNNVTIWNQNKEFAVNKGINGLVLYMCLYIHIYVSVYELLWRMKHFVRWLILRLFMLAQIFWKRLSKEYVSLLQLRHRWTQPEMNIGESNLVTTCTGFLEKDKWLLGLVMKMIPNSDRLRPMELRTSVGILIRDIRKLRLEVVDIR
ncbi:unnamed protein product [Schistosoma guineensis]|nr:unnamed protein product [Schistosoma guineensis]